MTMGHVSTLSARRVGAGGAASAGSALVPLSAACERAGLGRLGGRLDALGRWLAADLAAIERDLGRLAGDGDARHLAERAARELLARPGKRLRPLCVALAARLGGRALDRDVRDAALCAELVHAATLLHDDVIDEGTERRGAAAARVVYGNSASILAGDYLLVEALARLARNERSELLGSLLGTIAEMIDAESLQLELRGCFRPSREAYLRIARGKTASLFRWALAAGGTLGGLAPAQVDALGRAGTSLGVAFQLVDDLLDLAGDAGATGKTLHGDLRQGKLTWPLVVAAEREPSLGAALAAIAASERATLAQLATAVAVVRGTGAEEETRAFAELHAERAHEELATIPSSPAREALRLVVDAAVRRQK
jgi:octaprenyl-diphosphate synthase